MASSTDVGAIYGTGIYGIDKYGAYGVRISVDKVTGQGSIGSVNIVTGEAAKPTTVYGIITAGTVIISTTLFDYNGAASSYNRPRTVYIPRQSTSKERTVLVPAR